MRGKVVFTLPGDISARCSLAEIVNLNRFRKARQHDEKQRQAQENRVRFGRNKGEKASDRHEQEQFQRDHAGKKLSDDDSPPDESA
jgi:hypothetical protein